MLPFPRGPHPPPHGEKKLGRGNPTGRNHGNPGYTNNTRNEPDKDRAEGIDRHCSRPTRQGVMKCSECFDYNKGVRRGECIACGHTRFALGHLQAVLEGDELEDAALALQFEASVEHHRWSEEEGLISGVNTHAVVECARAVFAGKALVHKEGSVRKNTAVEGSDIDLMVTLASRKRMSDGQRDDLVRALRARTDLFREVNLGRHAIKITPHNGPSLDVVAHHSAFELSPTTLSYLAPAGTCFWGKAGAALAVSGLKVWWNHIKGGIRLKVFRLEDGEQDEPPARMPGHVWEKLVLTLEEELEAQASGDQASGRVKSGFDYFMQTVELLASDASGSRTTWNYPLGGGAVGADWTPIREAAKAALAIWGDSKDLHTAFGI